MIKNDSKEARMLLQYLQESYKCGEPIFLSDIHIKGMNRPNLYQQIKNLTKEKNETFKIDNRG